jgi:hypothetical protein
MIATAQRVPLRRWQRLFYRGPAIDVLFEQYARRRRIDGLAPISASCELVIDAPVERVWDVLSRPLGWPDIEPGIRNVRLHADVVEGTRFTWRNGRTRLTSRFAVVEPGRELTWTGSALGTKVVHRHLLAPTSDGTTHLRSEESMAGPLLVLFFSEAKLHAALEKWLNAIASAAAS